MNRASVNTTTYSLVLPLAAALCLLAGCGSTQFAAVSTGAASSTGSTSTPSSTTNPRTSYTSFGDSITCGYVAAGATTSSPFSIGDASCHTANAYPTYLAASWSLPLQNYGIPGDQACDIWPRQIAPQSVSPTTANAPLYTVMIGTNDAMVKGIGAYETNFSICEMAALTWLALPAESKMLPATATGSGWNFGSKTSLGAYAMTTTPGATLTFTTTTYGGPLYLWYVASDLVAGTASIKVDGDSMGSFSTGLSVPISTVNGTPESVAMERIAGLSAGKHVVVVTGLSGAVAVLGLGTPPQTPSANHPIVLAGSVPAPEQVVGNYLLAPDAAYTADTLALVGTLHADGLDVRFASNASFLTGVPAEMTDLVHVTPLGASHLAAAFQAVGP